MKSTSVAAFIGMIAVALAAPSLMAQCCSGCGHYHRHSWGGPGVMAWQGARPIYNPDTVTTLRGTVTAVKVEPSGRGRLGGLHLTVESEGKSTEVHLGPTWFTEREGIVFAKGDTVTVTGSLVGSEEEKYLVAREVKKGDKVLKLRDEQGIPVWAGSRRP